MRGSGHRSGDLGVFGPLWGTKYTERIALSTFTLPGQGESRERDRTSSRDVEFPAGPAQIVTDLTRDPHGTRALALPP